MKLREIMTSPAIRVHPEESAAVAARLLSRYNIGFLPVCGSSGYGSIGGCKAHGAAADPSASHS